MSVTTVMWYVGVLVELGFAIALVNSGMILFRTIWIMLGLVAFLAWALRRRLTESPRFDILKGRTADINESAKKLNVKSRSDTKEEYSSRKYAELFKKYGPFLLFSWFLYLIWEFQHPHTGNSFRIYLIHFILLVLG
ncbi:MAG: hypothetical protein RE470_00035 [Acidiplasma sp.]|nr:hypothetical protein [Acidiplasma sp.]WMT55053.1 MAG: hypothetical protein RE470_00035 [Acidiplasma sp.]